ncbi:MAG: helix-turn-helix domain-containing protein [Cellvibrionales bacterium]|nr:helix-turn-helix domain-containing protein [Cellvibrionales bacterium]
MQSVTFLLYPHMLTSSLTLPLEMLNAADNFARAQSSPGARKRSKLRIHLASQQGQAIETQVGLKLQPNQSIETLTSTDLLIIPGFWRSPFKHINEYQSLITAIQQFIHSNPDMLICAVGTGILFLAEAGILNGKAATTHWFYSEQMKKRYPQINWQKDHLITQSNTIYCTSSVNSTADLTIRFIELGFTRTIAKQVESQFSPEIRKNYDNQLFNDHLNQQHADELIAHAQALIQQRYNETINFEALAKSVNINYRTFQRRFKRACEMSPLQYQQVLRIDNAKNLLRETNLTIQEVAGIVGFIDASHFSALFKRQTSQSPKDYRLAVKMKLFRPY